MEEFVLNFAQLALMELAQHVKMAIILKIINVKNVQILVPLAMPKVNAPLAKKNHTLMILMSVKLVQVDVRNVIKQVV